LEFYGITCKFLNLIKSYLEDRYQKASICSNIHFDNISLDGKKITCSVPQGSIFGPLFFLTYISDLLKVLIQNALAILFTDDTNVIVPDSSIVDFQRNMKEVFE
jgi:hypothetical protein